MSRSQPVLIRSDSCAGRDFLAGRPLPVACCLSSFNPAERSRQDRGVRRAEAQNIPQIQSNAGSTEYLCPTLQYFLLNALHKHTYDLQLLQKRRTRTGRSFDLELGMKHDHVRRTDRDVLGLSSSSKQEDLPLQHRVADHTLLHVLYLPSVRVHGLQHEHLHDQTREPA